MYIQFWRIYTMAKGPVKGTRIPVKLPWKGATSNEDQFVSMKDTIADLLGFGYADDKDLKYKVKVKTKNGSKTVTRRRRPGYRTRAVRCEFGKDANGNRISKKIGGKTCESFQFPITTSVPIDEVVKFFETGGGKGLKVKRLVEANSGQGYPVRN